MQEQVLSGGSANKAMDRFSRATREWFLGAFSAPTPAQEGAWRAISSGSKARETLSEVDTVIVDEVHAVAGTKRGAHLAVSLERLDALLSKPAQRIGLSATVEPRELVAQFLAGSAPVEIVAPPSRKNWNL